MTVMALVYERINKADDRPEFSESRDRQVTSAINCSNLGVCVDRIHKKERGVGFNE